MAHSAVLRNEQRYTTKSYIIRARLFKGLKTGTMNVRSLYEEERVKLTSDKVCVYCGRSDNLTLDHLFPKSLGGLDTGDNLVYACKTCNSSKGDNDMLAWLYGRHTFPPLLLLRRYLKLAIRFCERNDLLDCSLQEIPVLPFRLDLLPTSFPEPQELTE